MHTVTTMSDNESLSNEDLVREYLMRKVEFETCKSLFEEAQDRLIKQMEANQNKTIRWREHRDLSNKDVIRTLTYVQGHTTYIDEAGLRKALTAKVYDRYTVRKLDRKAMETAMDVGKVEAKVVAPFVTMRPNKPFLKYSQKDAE